MSSAGEIISYDAVHPPVDALPPSVPDSVLPAARLERPVQAVHSKIVWHYAVPIASLHLLAFSIFIPWLFSWAGVAALIIGIYFYGGLGVNLCYHRLLAHRAFKCPLWVERVLVLISLCCLEDAPGRWVATHRLHHKTSDEREDPHTPLVNFLWSHVGWMLVENRGLHNISIYGRYAADILRQPFYMKLERRLWPIWIYTAHAMAYFLAGLGIGYLTGGVMHGIQLGFSLLAWGVIARTVAVWHITWSVNSLSHIWGYRSYETGEGSRNNWFVALITSGEGWHNNHHAFPGSASNSLRWWEIDLVYLTVRVMAKLGLAWDVNTPPPRKHHPPKAQP